MEHDQTAATNIVNSAGGAAPPPRMTIDTPLQAVEAILRRPRELVEQLGGAGAARAVWSLLVVMAVGLAGYGFIVGTFSGGAQLWRAPVKVMLLGFLSGLICLPSLYVFASLSGVEIRVRHAAGLLVGTMALMAVMLIGFGPVAWLFSASTESLAVIGFLHLLFWGIAVGFSFKFLGRALRLGGAAGTVLRLWMVILLFVMLQMSTTLRPMVGASGTFFEAEKKFFLIHWSECIHAPAH